MKKFLILFLVSCSGYSLFGSASGGGSFDNLLSSCLLERTDINALFQYKLDNFDTKLDLYEVKLGKGTWGQYLEKLNPKLFPRRDIILELLAPEPAIKDYVNTTGKSDGQQVAESVKSFISYPKSLAHAQVACCVYKAYPISVDEYKYGGEQSLRDALKVTKTSNATLALKNELLTLIAQEDTRRELRKRVTTCLVGIDSKACDQLDEFIKTEGLKEGEFLLDAWEKESSPHSVFAKEFKGFLKHCGASLPNGHEVIKRLSADQALYEPYLKEAWFLAANENWFDTSEREALGTASAQFMAGLNKNPAAPDKNDPVDELPKKDASKKPVIEKDTSSFLKKLVIGTAFGAVSYALYRYMTKSRTDANKQIV